ncbi:ERCC4_domain-containing protein [Hexamita inflata]|uniref:ERCC4 domain-containing protein n=1 Tax=Hexamita inflata TaxID=28002 RepID=A0AA86N8C7_9EUKA|nr:ERCC4 domain-containing protein [Hexamita inflata]
MLKVVFDSRGESQYYALLSEEYQSISSIKMLPIGDFAIYIDDELVAIVERKTASDLLSSVSDERLFRQLQDMSCCDCARFLLLECSQFDFQSLDSSFMHAVVNMLNEYLIKLSVCSDQFQSVRFYEHLIQVHQSQIQSQSSQKNILRPISSSPSFECLDDDISFTTAQNLVPRKINPFFQSFLVKRFGLETGTKLNKYLFQINDVKNAAEKDFRILLKNEMGFGVKTIDEICAVFKGAFK